MQVRELLAEKMTKERNTEDTSLLSLEHLSSSQSSERQV
jgi:hypothetical protein